MPDSGQWPALTACPTEGYKARVAKVIPIPNDDAAWGWRRAYRAAHPLRPCRAYLLCWWQSVETRARVDKLTSIRKGVETRRLQRLVKQTEARVCRPFPDTRRMALRRRAWREAVYIMKRIGGVEPKIGGGKILEGPIWTRVWLNGKWRKACYPWVLMPLHLVKEGDGTDPRTVFSERPDPFSFWTAVLLARAGCTWGDLCVPYDPYYNDPIPWLVEVRALTFGEAIQHCRRWAAIGSSSSPLSGRQA